MPEFDLVIRGGTIVDGTGIPKYKGDVAIKNGRISKISGNIKPGGAKEIDANGCILGPGAIDLHTHYDAQLNWDPYATLSGWFGVTSVSIGQCGFGFAPTRPEDRDLNMRMMNRIEAIPLESMRQGMRWDWVTYPEYLDSLDQQGLGVNVGSMFPFSPLRGWVLGMLPSRERTSVTDKELNEMKRIFYEAMKAGAFGFTADKSEEDRTEDGGWLPSHVAANEEFLALAEVLGEFSVGHLGWTAVYSGDQDEQRQLISQMVRLSGRPAHVGDDYTQPGSIAWMKAARAEGLPIIYQTLVWDIESRFRLAEYNLFDIFPNWVQPFVGTPTERAAKLRDPQVRAAMKSDAEKYSTQSRMNWAETKVVEVAHERNYKYEGLAVQDIGEMEGKHPLDAMLDLALDEDLETEFSHSINGMSDEMIAEGIKNPYTHISLSDGGAHTRFSTASLWPVYFLAHWIRDKEIMTLEKAHYKMSTYPAWIADFKDRGMLRKGAWADIIVYDLENLGMLHERAIYANDFPGGERRLIQKPTGLRYTIVNGVVTFEGNECTGALPGKLMRSYDMVG